MTTGSGPKNPLVSSFDTYMETEEATDMLRYIQASKPSAVLFKAFRAGQRSAVLNAGGEIEVHIINDYMPPVGVSAVKPEPQASPDGTARDLSTVEKRNAFYSSDEYRSMTTAEKCAAQPDGFINDYD